MRVRRGVVVPTEMEAVAVEGGPGMASSCSDLLLIFRELQRASLSLCITREIYVPCPKVAQAQRWFSGVQASTLTCRDNGDNNDGGGGGGDGGGSGYKIACNLLMPGG